ncbi:methane monooxygenase component A subunit gamma [Methylococcus capsulatus]|uniref:methane monooxygenase component A subunit gamma n=1 Tax=Methylococcus capsulatus TaxID=414 RepID=UPI0002F20B50|nr:methane monooxygenase component A subunit gamma [Methylococcus capsulatus]
MAKLGIHSNDTRDAWVNKIAQLNTLEKAAEMLKQFRMDHTTPFRNSYELDNDYLWIEAKLEEKVAVLKARAFNEVDFRHKTAFGEDAKSVLDGTIAKMNAAKDKWEAEKIHIGFRQAYKPPIMPVNYFLDGERQLGTRLMELRNLNYYDTPLEELRKQRGVRVVHLQAPH